MRKKLSLPGVEHMSSKGITQRWLFNSLGLILAILIVIELAMAFIVQDYYYSGIRWQLGNIMTTTQESFSRYANQSQSEFASRSINAVENFSLKEQVELQVLIKTATLFFLPPALLRSSTSGRTMTWR